PALVMAGWPWQSAVAVRAALRAVDLTGSAPHKRDRFLAGRQRDEYLLAGESCRNGRVSRVAKGADCKSAGLRLRRFESYLSHHQRSGISSQSSERGILPSDD